MKINPENIKGKHPMKRKYKEKSIKKQEERQRKILLIRKRYSALFLVSSFFIGALSPIAIQATVPFSYSSWIAEPVKDNPSLLWAVVLNQKLLPQLRFYGNYSSEANEKYPLHPAFEKNSKNNCPQDAVAAVIQYLFPSVDGVILTHNDRSDDPFGIIAKGQDKAEGLKVIELLLDYASKYKAAKSSKEQELAELQKAILDQLGKIKVKNEVKRKEDAVRLTLEKFLNIFSRALQEQHDLSSRDIYPPHIVEHTLLAFAWRVANKLEELKTVSESLKSFQKGEHQEDSKQIILMPEPSENRMQISKIEEKKPPLFTQEEYNKQLPGFLEKLQTFEIELSHLALFSLGYDLYSRLVPPLIQYRNTSSKSSDYPDCGESSLRNLFYLLFGGHGQVRKTRLEEVRKKINPIDFDTENYSAIQKRFLKFFEDNPDIAAGGTTEAHKEWSDIVSNLNETLQLKTIEYKNKKSEVAYEIPGRAGITNMLQIIGTLLGDKALLEPWLSEEKDKLAQVSKKLKRLCEIFSTDEYILNWNTIQGPNITSNVPIDIRFTINDKEAFVWMISKIHFEILSLEEERGDWRTQLPLPYLSSLSPYLQVLFLRPLVLTAHYNKEIKPYHLWGLNLRKMETAAQTINFILQEKREDLYFMIPLLLEKSIPWEDQHAQKVLGPILRQYEKILRKKKLLPNERNIELAFQKYNTFDLRIACQYGYSSWVEDFVKKFAPLGNEKQPAWDSILSAALSLGIEHGHTFLISFLLKAGAQFDKKDQKGYTVLHKAAQSGHLEALEILLEKAGQTLLSDEFIQDEEGNTPLHLAASEGHLSMVEALLKIDQKGILLSDKFIKNEEENTPLHLAASKGHLSIVEALLQGNPKKTLFLKKFIKDDEDQYETTLLHLAASKGHLSLVRTILNSENMKDSLSAEELFKDGKGNTPLHLAASKGDLSTVKILLEKAGQTLLSDKFIQDSNQNTPLHFAASGGHLSIVEALLEKAGQTLLSDKFIQDSNKNTPLHLAASEGHLSTVEALLKGEGGKALLSDKYIQNKNRNTPLHLAASEGHLSTVEALLKGEVGKTLLSDKFIQATNKKTPLHFTASKGHLSTVKILLEKAGQTLLSDKFIQDSNQNTPLHLAASKGHLSIVEALLEKAGQTLLEKKLTRNEERNTPLHLAASGGHLSTVEALLKIDQKGILLSDEFIQNEERNTPLHLAASKGHLSTVEALLKIDQKGILLSDKFIKNENSETPFSLAIKGERLEVIQAFLKQEKYSEVLVQQKTKELVNFAINKNHFDVLEEFVNLEPGQDLLEILLEIFVPSKLVDYLIKNSWNEMFLNLLKRNPELIKEEDELDGNLCYRVVKARNLTALKSLLQQEKQLLNEQDLLGDTPLHLAIKQGDIEIAEYLLGLKESQESCTIKNKENKTPFELAIDKGKSEIVELFLNSRMVDVKKYFSEKEKFTLLIEKAINTDREDYVNTIEVLIKGLAKQNLELFNLMNLRPELLSLMSSQNNENKPIKNIALIDYIINKVFPRFE